LEWMVNLSHGWTLMRKNILLIGQAPSRTGLNPLEALTPTSASGRLMNLMGLTVDEYLGSFRRINLIDEYPGRLASGNGDKFPMRQARAKAKRILQQMCDFHILCIGKRVGQCFNLDECFVWEERIQCYPLTRNRIAMIPHTSGLNRFYNSPDNVRQAETFLREDLLC